MSASLSFIAVKALPNKMNFSKEECDIIVKACQEFDKNYFVFKDKTPVHVDVVEISKSAFFIPEENKVKNSWYEMLPENVLNKIRDILKYLTHYYIETKTGEILVKACAERWFSTTPAREIYENVLHFISKIDMSKTFSWYELSDVELLELSDIFFYLENGIRTNVWDQKKEYNLNCSAEFVNEIGIGIYGYNSWKNRNIVMYPLSGPALSNNDPKNMSLPKLIKLIKDIWTTNSKSKTDDGEDEEYFDDENDDYDIQERFRLIDLVNEMCSFFSEVNRLKNEESENEYDNKKSIRVISMYC